MIESVGRTGCMVRPIRDVPSSCLRLSEGVVVHRDLMALSVRFRAGKMPLSLAILVEKAPAGVRTKLDRRASQLVQKGSAQDNS